MAITQPTPSDLSGCATEVATNFVADANNYDSRLGNTIVILASEAASEVTSLNTRISTASSTDTSSTTSLTTRISTEESTRLSADTSLDTRIDTGFLPIDLLAFRETSADGDVGDITANGGILASDTSPILRATGKTQEISWAAGNADPISVALVLPPSFVGTSDVTVDLWVYTDNAGGGGIDAATFTVESSWDGGAAVSDTATDGTPAITIHKNTATIANADIPNTARLVTFILTPAAHAADPIQLVGMAVNFTGA
jgi:hypothetical protein